jgi:hypothetical protein
VRAIEISAIARLDLLTKAMHAFDRRQWSGKCAYYRMGEHIPIDRAWILIQESSLLSDAEAEHLDNCPDCREFLRSFLSVARYVGFSVSWPDVYQPVSRDHAA